MERPAATPSNGDAAASDDRGPVTQAEGLELDSQGHTPQQIQSLRRIYESRARAHRAESNLDRLLVLDALAGITKQGLLPRRTRGRYHAPPIGRDTAAPRAAPGTANQFGRDRP